MLLLPVIIVWTLPQTLAGLVLALWHRLRGTPVFLYAFGPSLFFVVPTPPPASCGISLGAVVFADRPEILTHEFCHLYTGLWLGWLYLPVYGLEYLVLGHDRSFHERVTCRFERTTRQGWVRLR